MRGHPVQILHVKDTGYELDAEALDEILLAENVRDKKVVILSVAGAFRKGKSFLLSFLLRYLEAMGSPEWMGDQEEPLKGFSWQSGWKGHTTGILMWSEAYIVDTADHGEVAVILLDTQGAFDTKYAMGECATVFALSTMVSSVQVYNISQNIQETDLQHLQLFTEYGKLAQEQNSSSTPFQKLQFLVRDWSYLQDFKYGINGGREYLNEILSSSGREKAELQQVRQHIKSCFSDISCFLMPYPGEAVASDSGFDGRLSGISETFREELANYVPMLLAPENMATKHIGGIEITAKELCNYFKVYIAMFQGDKLPTPYTIYEATAHANNQLASERAKDHYKEKMDKICNWDSPSIGSSQLEEEHLNVMQSAIILFRNTRKMGQRDISSAYDATLKVDLEAMKAKYQEINDAKHEMEQAKLQHKKKEDDHRMKQEEFQKDMELMRQEKERMQQELEEARIAGAANQDELKDTLDKYLKETERLHDIQKQNERDFRNEQEDWKRRLYNFELEKEALRRQIAESEMMRKMDEMKAQHERELKQLKDHMKAKEESECTVL